MKPNPLVALAIGLASICFGLSGCVTDGYVGVSAYPDYRPYYSYYGYGGLPYYGYGGIYRRSIIVRGQRHWGGYGRQHFWRDRRQAVRPGVSRPSKNRPANPPRPSRNNRANPR